MPNDARDAFIKNEAKLKRLNKKKLIKKNPLSRIKPLIQRSLKPDLIKVNNKLPEWANKLNNEKD